MKFKREIERKQDPRVITPKGDNYDTSIMRGCFKRIIPSSLREIQYIQMMSRSDVYAPAYGDGVMIRERAMV